MLTLQRICAQNYCRLPLNISFTDEQKVAQDLRKIIIPGIAFTNAPFSEVIEFFREKSIIYDDPDKPADQRGINIETGKPLELDRKGSRVAVVPLGKKSKLDNLVRHDVIVGDPQALIAMNLTAPDIKTALTDIEQTPDLLAKALKLAGLVTSLFREAGWPLVVVGGSAVEFYAAQDDRRVTWQEWQSRRKALREQTRRVGPAVTRRQESSADSRLRTAFNGRRAPGA